MLYNQGLISSCYRRSSSQDIGARQSMVAKQCTPWHTQPNPAETQSMAWCGVPQGSGSNHRKGGNAGHFEISLDKAADHSGTKTTFGLSFARLPTSDAKRRCAEA